MEGWSSRNRVHLHPVLCSFIQLCSCCAMMILHNVVILHEQGILLSCIRMLSIVNVLLFFFTADVHIRNGLLFIEHV